MAKRVLTIGRQFGSGGHRIGKILGERLGIQCYDSRLIDMAAEKGRLDKEQLKGVDEKKGSSFLYTVPGEVNELTGFYRPMNDMLFTLQSGVIRELAMRESCIIVGRCADDVLAEHIGTISVFIGAEMESRIQRVQQRHELSEREAIALIKKMDKQRSCYYNFYTEKRWGRRESYHITLDSGRLGIEGCVRLLQTLFEQ